MRSILEITGHAYLLPGGSYGSPLLAFFRLANAVEAPPLRPGPGIDCVDQVKGTMVLCISQGCVCSVIRKGPGSGPTCPIGRGVRQAARCIALVALNLSFLPSRRVGSMTSSHPLLAGKLVPAFPEVGFAHATCLACPPACSTAESAV
ncbi:hypothetical protein ABW21_db0207384 [Orbilia brochopaga]|nr:hypothetical protein ABW21_db0207384 [Drechslerella brochopaga]